MREVQNLPAHPTLSDWVRYSAMPCCERATRPQIPCEDLVLGTDGTAQSVIQ